MPQHHPVPDDKKWQIAARIVTTLPLLYDICFRDIVGEEYDRIEQKIWITMAQEAAKVAATFRLPTGNADELAQTLDLVSVIFFGPDMRSERVRLSPERSVLVVKRCPFEIPATGMQMEGERLFHRCMAFSIAAVEAMNPDYTLRFVRSMCMGDGHCEMKVMKVEEARAMDRK
jgi:hypothetical protein